MRHSKQKILESLMVIYETCDEMEDCPDCPFYAEKTCMINYVNPDGWVIKQEKEPETWRAFVE